MITDGSWEYVRKKIFKYPKSGKLVIAPITQQGGGSFIMDLDNNFNYVGLRTVKRNPYVHGTTYVADVLINSKKENNQIVAQFKLLRVLNEKEVDLEFWKPSKRLEKLKILPAEFLTEEESYWAGKVNGNEVEFFGWWGALIAFIFFAFKKGLLSVELSSSWPIFLIIGLGIFFIKSMKLIRTKKPIEKKINQLMAYKRKIIKDNKNQIGRQLSELDVALGKYTTWTNLSPIAFEGALKRKLNNTGMKVDTTKTTGDGGIDLTGVDENKKSVLIQAKKYSKPVGVSVVREMIGVRQNYQNKPRTIIYSLEGFTKGAYDLANEHDIELKSIRDDLIGK